MIIAIISDTHDNVYAVKEIIEHLKDINPDLLIHLGDIISPNTLELCKGFKAVFIRGNNDGDINKLEFITKKNHQLFTPEFSFTTNGKRLIAIHGHTKELDIIINSGLYDYVLHGHTHEIKIEKKGKTLILNPGAHYPFSKGGIILLDTNKPIDVKEIKYIPITGKEVERQ